MIRLGIGLRELPALVLVALLFVAGLALCPGTSVAQPKETPEKTKYREAARAHFEKRCRESAGERIHRTVDNVEGFLLSSPQTEMSEANLRDQFWKGNLYGFSLYPPAELGDYLHDLDENYIPTIRTTARRGFQFVEVPGRDGTFLRYRRDLAVKREMSSVAIEASQSRYAVVREDISTREDRSFWVAGGRLKIVDLKSNEILGERIGYVFEAGFGSTSYARRPWLFAQRNACPPIPRNVAIDRLFVEKVLRPAKENRHAR